MLKSGEHSLSFSHPYLINPRCMHEGYGSHSVCVCVCACVRVCVHACVCVCVTKLAAMYLVCTLKTRWLRFLLSSVQPSHTFAGVINSDENSPELVRYVHLPLQQPTLWLWP